MRFKVENKTRENIENLMRISQYHLFGYGKTQSEMNFFRALGQDSFPRFHLFLRKLSEKEPNVFEINLHLDQRKPVYKGATHSHNADYEGEVVEKEAERIKNFFAL